MRRKIVAGNWKMNLDFQEAQDLVEGIANLCEEKQPDCDIIICPPFPYLEMTSDMADDTQYFYVGAQNVNDNDSGAYTGEVSAKMLDSLGTQFCIVGHSERRKYYNEDNALLAVKIKKLLEYQIVPIYCVGEVLEEREANTHFDVIKKQIEEALFNLDVADMENVVIAYEPVWAIGTGKTATPQQAEEVHKFIRTLICEKFGEDIANQIRILYGGSCNAKNASDLFAQENIDGGLIGGASLKAEDFISIAVQASK
ncbi:MAG: triose-phosphate isomerase [Lentimicrobiaceae bacterium]|nr:triose-phosphate isomerase [Lentimicrobiaceae bacterium]